MCHLYWCHTKRAQTLKGAILRGWKGSDPLTNVQLTQTKMTVDFSKDVMLGMLRRGNTGTEILEILETIVDEETEKTEQA